VGEDWESALKREAFEEAGIEIDGIKVLGYVLAEHDNDTIKFPKKSILPVTISFVKKVNYNWKKNETLDRNFFRKKDVLKKFLERDDNKQLYKIYSEVVYPYLKNNYKVEFEFTEKIKDFEVYPITQTMSFVSVKDKFLVVRDYDEEEFSLIGGGCDMDENIYSSAKREIWEEAQIKIDELDFLGSVIVKILDDIKVVSKSQQMRFLGCKEEYNISNFIPRKDGFEIEEVKLIELGELEKTKILNNPNGKKILDKLKEYDK